MIRVTRRDNVLCIETNNGEMWIPEEFVRDTKCRLEMRILYDLADYLEKQPAAAPVVDPSRLGAAMTAFDAAGGKSISYAPAWMCKALEAASTPAAPGIDLAVPDCIKQAHDKCKLWPESNWPGFEPDAGFMAFLEIRNWVETLIDASPKGGSNERARFEAWAEWFGVGVTRNFFTDKYNDKLSEDLWCAWQSASQNGPPEKAVDQWHSIETAPKDGTLIDLWNHETAYRSTYMMWGRCSDPKEKDNRGWVSAFGSSGFFCPNQFSHWRHAPAPPLVNRKATSAEVGE